MAHTIIDTNPTILSYYRYFWTYRDRQYTDPCVADQMNCQTIKHMPLPTYEQWFLLQQHLNTFQVFLDNRQVRLLNKKLVNALTVTKSGRIHTPQFYTIFVILKIIMTDSCL